MLSIAISLKFHASIEKDAPRPSRRHFPSRAYFAMEMVLIHICQLLEAPFFAYLALVLRYARYYYFTAVARRKAIFLYAMMAT